MNNNTARRAAFFIDGALTLTRVKEALSDRSWPDSHQALFVAYELVFTRRDMESRQMFQQIAMRPDKDLVRIAKISLDAFTAKCIG